MSKLNNAVAVITGGGSGIGRSMALDAARRGAKVVVADIAAARADAVAAEIVTAGGQAVGTACDVASLEGWQALAATAVQHFGSVNLLCNNAGVCIGGPVESTKPNDVQWMFEVNVFSICHSIRVFAPLLREAAQRGELAHILNTGSENSLGTPPLGPTGVYNATKHAVMSLSDNARIDLAPSGIGVSILCPALVRTNLLHSMAHRPERLGGAKELPAAAAARADAIMAAQGHDPDSTARIGLDGVEAGRFVIVPHPEVRGFAEARMRQIADAIDEADARNAT